MTAATDANTNELAELYPAPRVINVRLKRVSGEGPERKVEWDAATITVEELDIGQLGRMAKALQPIAHAITNGAPNILSLITDHPDEIIAAIAPAIGWSPAKVASIDAPGFLEVALAVFEVNSDLFLRRLGLAVSVPRTTPAVQIDGAGPTPSPISNAGAPPGQIASR